MIDDEAPRVAAGRGDADTGPAHSPGPVAGEAKEENIAEKTLRLGIPDDDPERLAPISDAVRRAKEKVARHGTSFKFGTASFLRSFGK